MVDLMGAIMENKKRLDFIAEVLKNKPEDWLNLTTHRLDIYNEEQAKTAFLEAFEQLFDEENVSPQTLHELPTAYDYIRLGHPLSSVLEWTLAQLHNTNASNIISFSSGTMPIFAVLRTNLLLKKKTQICYQGELPANFDTDIIRNVYGYHFELKQVENASDIAQFDGSTLFLAQSQDVCTFSPTPNIDFIVNMHPKLGSIILINTTENEAYVSEIQHVRRRETIAMTPANCLIALNNLIGKNSSNTIDNNLKIHQERVQNSIKEITGTASQAVVASSGLSTQYAIMMGLVHHAMEHHPGKAIQFIVPPNCYGGTNDQARRVAACIDRVEVIDLPVDAGNDMVTSLTTILDRLAKIDAVPYIIAEIPTNPRVEVPNLNELRNALSKTRQTSNGETAIEPVFILDQTFCPNTPFLGKNDILSTVKALSYASGSKFPSGGKCTAGYCVANQKAETLLQKIALHLELCDNEATDLQYEILAEQLPSMIDRIAGAYQNTREFVNFIQEILPEGKINFVSEELAAQGFTPSVFSLDLPTKGNTPEERETFKRALNLQLINRMITTLPNESKYCVSYGQLKGCYWTIPATSTQGTTKEGDKDYIARVALSPQMDLEGHKKVFSDFVDKIRVEIEPTEASHS